MTLLAYIFNYFPGILGRPPHKEADAYRKIPLRWVIAGLLLLALFFWLFRLSKQFHPDIPLTSQPILTFVAIMLIAGLVFLYIAELIIHSANFKRLMIWVLLVGGIMRGCMFFSVPILEVDFNRYLWDGAVTANGINPYAFSPEEIMENLSVEIPQRLLDLAETEGATIDKINHAYLRTIYPSVVQAAFALAYFISPWEHVGWRLVLLLFDLATLIILFVILKELQLSPLWIAIYWLNPLLVKEMTNAMHMDLLIFPFLLLAILYATRARYNLSVVFLALATAVKIWPALLFPILLRPLWPDYRRLLTLAAFFAALCLLLFAPVLITSLDQNSGFNAYSNRWQLNDSGFRILLWLSHFGLEITGYPTWKSQGVARILTALIILSSVAYLSLKTEASLEAIFEKCLIVITVIFLFSPTQFPWYSMWLLPFLVIRRQKSLLLLTLLMPLYYLRYYYESIGDAAFFDNYIVWLEFIPVWVLLFWEWRESY